MHVQHHLEVSQAQEGEERRLVEPQVVGEEEFTDEEEGGDKTGNEIDENVERQKDSEKYGSNIDLNFASSEKL